MNIIFVHIFFVAGGWPLVGAQSNTPWSINNVTGFLTEQLYGSTAFFTLSVLPYLNNSTRNILHVRYIISHKIDLAMSCDALYDPCKYICMCACVCACKIIQHRLGWNCWPYSGIFAHHQETVLTIYQCLSGKWFFLAECHRQNFLSLLHNYI